jgi:predicted MarR family transcription regulator
LVGSHPDEVVGVGIAESCRAFGIADRSLRCACSGVIIVCQIHGVEMRDLPWILRDITKEDHNDTTVFLESLRKLDQDAEGTPRRCGSCSALLIYRSSPL